jgi:hypothetical protein
MSHFLYAMYPIKPSDRSMSPLYELQHLRGALYRLNAIGETNSRTIADLKRIVALRIKRLESVVEEFELIEA